MWNTPQEQRPATAKPPPAKAKLKGQKKGDAGKPPKPPRKRWITVVKWLAIVGFSGFLLLVATVAFVFWMYGRDPKLPDYSKLGDYQPRQVTTILDANDDRIGEIYTERRTYVPYEKVPKILVDSFVAAEDASFWTHSGVDYWGMFRAFLKNVRAGGRSKQGASTITQQVVKTFLLTPEKTFKRKIQEIILARRLEKALTKEEIMTLYVNQIYFGHGRYGVQEAARFYFGKNVEKLNAGEAALIAGLPQSPNNISPHVNPQRAKERQTYVLNQLVTTGAMTMADAQKWIDAPIQVVSKPFPKLGTAPEWVELAKQEIIAEKGEAALDTMGAKIRTTLDPSLQASALKALQHGLRGVDKRQGIGHPVRTLKADKIESTLRSLRARLPGSGPKAKEIYESVVIEVFDDDNEVVVDLGGWKGSLLLGRPGDERFNPPDADGKKKKPSERFKPGDVVLVAVPQSEVAAAIVEGTGDEDDAPAPKQAKALAAAGPKHSKHQIGFPPAPQGAVVIIDLKTRKVRALVGGYQSKAGGFNRATMAKRQPGSSFKPFVYAAAIDSGRYTPASKVNDAPEVFDLWKPKNYETGKFEGPVLLRHALAKSINTVAIRVTYDMKPENIAAFANKMGIKSKLPNEMSLALGSGEVTPLEMTNAVATLAAGGVSAPPKFVEAIDGVPTPPSKGEQVLRPEVAYVVVDMMRSVVTEGTGNRAAALKIPIAGKTGTSNDGRDTWFIGMTPDYAIGVWLGNDDNRSLGRGETGGTSAVPVFVEIAKSMSLPAKSFSKPARVTEATIDRATGLLAPEGAPKGTSRTEVFVEGSAPTEIAALPGDVTEDNVVTDEYTD
ncbi:MAG: PBP1A family penicillin-binding protein [Deltaproteobacteria bacterium]|nr:PBP1A family penicillin-binding protein [Deltaproteobacteria bacterium]